MLVEYIGFKATNKQNGEEKIFDIVGMHIEKNIKEKLLFFFSVMSDNIVKQALWLIQTAGGNAFKITEQNSVRARQVASENRIFQKIVSNNAVFFTIAWAFVW